MNQSNALEVLNQLKQDYQNKVLNIITAQLKNELIILKSHGVKSFTIVFEEDYDGNVYFDDDSGIIVSSEEDVKTDSFPLSNVVDMVYFLVENVKLDSDDSIVVSEDKVVIKMRHINI